MELRTVLLDAGGTLLTEEPAREVIYAEVAAAHGVPVAPAAMRLSMHRMLRTLPRTLDGHFRYTEGWFRRFIAGIFGDELGLGREAVDAATADLFRRFADPRTFRLHGGALELVRGARERGARVGVVSNWSERLPELLAGLGVAPWLDAVVVSAVEGVEKPDRAIFERALGRLGAEPATTVHAGDRMEEDVRGAGSAGILAVLVDRAGRHGDCSVPRVAGLPELDRWIQERMA